MNVDKNIDLLWTIIIIYSVVHIILSLALVFIKKVRKNLKFLHGYIAISILAIFIMFISLVYMVANSNNYLLRKNFFDLNYFKFMFLFQGADTIITILLLFYLLVSAFEEKRNRALQNNINL